MSEEKAVSINDTIQVGISEDFISSLEFAVLKLHEFNSQANPFSFETDVRLLDLEEFVASARRMFNPNNKEAEGE